MLQIKCMLKMFLTTLTNFKDGSSDEEKSGSYGSRVKNILGLHFVFSGSDDEDDLMSCWSIYDDCMQVIIILPG